MFWFCLNNVPRTPALSFSHACIENRPFLAHPGSKRCLTPFRLGKIRAGRKSLAVLKSRFLREYAINFGNSFFASSVYVSSTGYDSLSSGVNTIGGLGMIMWVYRFLWNTRYYGNSMEIQWNTGVLSKSMTWRKQENRMENLDEKEWNWWLLFPFYPLLQCWKGNKEPAFPLVIPLFFKEWIS